MRRGFSLLEILIVISVIGLLAVVGMRSYSNITKNARDARRKSDIDLIAKSLDQYYSVCGYVYPTPVDLGGTVGFQTIICPDPTLALLPVVPDDPMTTPYVCVGCTSERYELCADLELDPAADDYCIATH